MEKQSCDTDKMEVYYREFDDLSSLNEWILEAVEKENIISINYCENKHCIYFWM